MAAMPWRGKKQRGNLLSSSKTDRRQAEIRTGPSAIYISTRQNTTAFLTSAFELLNARNKPGSIAGSPAVSASVGQCGTSLDSVLLPVATQSASQPDMWVVGQSTHTHTHTHTQHTHTPDLVPMVREGGREREVRVETHAPDSCLEDRGLLRLNDGRQHLQASLRWGDGRDQRLATQTADGQQTASALCNAP